MTRTALFTLITLALSPPATLAQAAPLSPDAGAAWTGVYGGLKAESFASGDMAYNYVDPNYTFTAPYPLTGTTELGAFLGYNFAYGNFVFGPELAWTKAGPAENPVDAYHMREAYDLKARIGYVTGRALLYGFAGYTQSRWGDSWDVEDIDGMIYGVGVDVLFDNGMFAGLEYARRDMEGSYLYQNDFVEVDTTSLSLRVGYRF